MILLKCITTLVITASENTESIVDTDSKTQVGKTYQHKQYINKCFG